MKSEYYSEAPPILKEFIGYIETIKGKSNLTAEEYYLDLRTFLRYMKKTKNKIDIAIEFEEISISDVDIELIKLITLVDVFEFMNFLKNDRQNGAAARARKTSSIRAFFNYLTAKTGKLDTNPVLELDTPKLKKSLPKYLTLEQSVNLLENIDGNYKERDYCMITLFLNCGLRLSELVGLNLQDIRSDNTMRVIGKGDKERILYLNDACLDALKNYMKVRPVDGVIDKNALFISRNKKRISKQMVQNIVKKNLDKIGLEGQGYSVHKLRHTAATLMYQHGNVDILVLKDVLGHENLGTTEIYTHLSSKQLQEASKANPLSNIKGDSKKEDKSR